MAVYLLVFFVSVFSTYVAENMLKFGRRLSFLLFSVIAVVTPSALGGLRDSGVGTDTLVYIDRIYNRVSHITSFEQFITFYLNGRFDDIELTYLLINYSVHALFGSLNWLYFFTTLIVVLLFYLAAYDNRKRGTMWLSMAFFFFLFYNQSFNIIRQSIALGMTLYAFKYVEARRWIPLIIWSFLIISTHSTGIFFVLVCAIHLTSNSSSNAVRRPLKLFIFASLIFGVFALDYVIIFVVVLGIVPEKFLSYLSVESEAALTKSILLLYILFIFMLTLIKIGIEKEKRGEIAYYGYVKILGTILFLTSLVSKWGFRIGLYMNVLDCIFIPRALKLWVTTSRVKNLATLVNLILLSVLGVIWYWTIIVNNGNQTYPYKSGILGI